MNFKDYLYKELLEAYYKARVGGKRKTLDEHRFETNDIENILRLRDTIIARSYHPMMGISHISIVIDLAIKYMMVSVGTISTPN